jgi:hypothetical protein
MVSNASLMGANAVISMRFDSSELNNSMSEIVAYGTAVSSSLTPARHSRRSRPMLPAMRVAIGIGSILALGFGLALVVDGGISTWSGLWLIGLGAAGLIGITFERMRYRSAAAERSGEPAGPAGIDAGPPDPRFRPTDERFEDPTTSERLRVWIDPRTGERRYRRDE